MYIYFLFLHFLGTLPGPEVGNRRETCARHFDKTCYPPHPLPPNTHETPSSDTYTCRVYMYCTRTHIRQMARSSLGGTYRRSKGGGGYFARGARCAAARFNAKRASLTNLFFIPPLSSFILPASGLLHVDHHHRRPRRIPIISSKCVWNGKKKKSFRNIPRVLLYLRSRVVAVVFSRGWNPKDDGDEILIIIIIISRTK